MSRITESMLEERVGVINTLLGTDRYHLEYAYGGVTLLRYTRGSVCEKVLGHLGYVSKRVLYDNLTSFLVGVRTGKGNI